MKNLVCKLSDDHINVDNGIFNKLNDFCKKKINSDTCQKFYDNLQISNDGIYTCPYGFNCIKHNTNIYNCLLLKDKFQRSKIKQKKDIDQKVYSQDEIYQMIFIDEENYNNLKNIELSFKNISDFLHDITKANRIIENKSKGISKKQMMKTDKSKVESIYHLSDFISKRIELYRVVSNPAIIEIGRKRQRNAYKLWDIYRYVFADLAHEKKISIEMNKYNLNEETDNMLDTMFVANDSVSILPFLLIDNAVKYSAENSKIIINFYQDEGKLKKINIVSTPSYIILEEPNLFFDRGYRSEKNTSRSSGSGLGLSIVKQICDYNDIDIKINVMTTEYNNDKNQQFIVEMLFN